MARVDFRNGRHVYVSTIEDGDEAWLQAVNSGRRSALLRRDLTPPDAVDNIRKRRGEDPAWTPMISGR